MSLPTSALRLPARIFPAGGAYGAESREQDSHIPSIELLQGMALSDFLESGLVVVVRCAVLGEEVVWAANRTPTSRLGFDGMGRVVYHGEELRLLLAFASDPETLRSYHAMRKAVGRVEVESLTWGPPAGEQPEKTLDPETPKRGAA